MVNPGRSGGLRHCCGGIARSACRRCLDDAELGRSGQARAQGLCRQYAGSGEAVKHGDPTHSNQSQKRVMS
jgi:hypothetical protein